MAAATSQHETDELIASLKNLLREKDQFQALLREKDDQLREKEDERKKTLLNLREKDDQLREKDDQLREKEDERKKTLFYDKTNPRGLPDPIRDLANSSTYVAPPSKLKLETIQSEFNISPDFITKEGTQSAFLMKGKVHITQVLFYQISN